MSEMLSDPTKTISAPPRGSISHLDCPLDVVGIKKKKESLPEN
jgi:hypothetical protein